jgi:hypothetical protein
VQLKMADPLDAQDAFRQLMRQQVAPPLRDMGFKGSLRVFTFAGGNHAGSLRLQKSRYSSKQVVEFTFHVGAPCMGSEPITDLMPYREPPVPYFLFQVRADQPTAPVAEAVLAAVDDYAAPAILAGLDGADHDPEPGQQLSPPLPPLTNRAYDGAGAGPDAWFVRPTGSELDFAFADLADQSANSRFGAAQTIARLGMTDPRAVPALLDRLRHDLSPHVRREIASRMLAPIAHSQQVRQALSEAAAGDEDHEVRWAARYALRLDLRQHDG